MIAQPPVDILHSFARLTADTDFVRVLEWLQAEKEAAVSDLLGHTKEILVFQQQGYVRCLEDLIKTARSARAVLRAPLQDGAMNT